MRNTDWIAVTHKLNVRLEDSMLDELRVQAKKKRISLSELIRTYIEWGFETDSDDHEPYSRFMGFQPRGSRPAGTPTR